MLLWGARRVGARGQGGLPRRAWLSQVAAAAEAASSPAVAATAAAAPSETPAHDKTFHKRELPTQLVAMSSVGGKQLFKEALAQHGMESFFPLSEQFVTQSEPSFCALSTLAMVLNALNHDPGKVWKGPWRWISEETLQCETRNICGHSLDRVKRYGMDFNEFESLAQCHGVRIQSFRSQATASATDCRSQDSQLRAFRATIAQTAASAAANSFVIVNFSRKALGQTGDGHFSPVGGYHPAKDLALVLDVARFKYPPFWVPVADLWRSMGAVDEVTGLSRGYFVVSSTGAAAAAGGAGAHAHAHAHTHAHGHGHDHSNCSSHGHSH